LIVPGFAGPPTLQVTAVFVVPVTVALKLTVPFTATVGIWGATVTPTRTFTVTMALACDDVLTTLVAVTVKVEVSKRFTGAV
jgi:hypothetical protein